MIDLKGCRQFAALLARLDAPETSSRKPEAGTLAQLRRGLGKAFGEAPLRDGWVLRALDEVRKADLLSEEWTERDIEAACLVASLFASHRGASSERFGRSFRQLWQLRGEAASVARRFTILLDADERDLGNHLRQAVSLFKAEEVGLDWGHLLLDVVRWTDPERRVQRRWSRDFWLTAPAKRNRPTPKA